MDKTLCFDKEVTLSISAVSLAKAIVCTNIRFLTDSQERELTGKLLDFGYELEVVEKAFEILKEVQVKNNPSQV